MRTRSLAVVLSLLALVLALSGAGSAATGGNFILGKQNSADATTTLAAPVGGGTALQLSNTNTAAGSTALSLNVVPGHPPLTVNSGAGKVPNLNVDRLDGLEANRFWQLGGNTINNLYTLGTKTNQPLWLIVNGQNALRLVPNATSPILVGGFSGNSVDPAASGATIAGGGLSGAEHTITTSGDYSTIGGGYGNTASANLTFVGGGNGNEASGPNSAIAGGQGNTAGGSASGVAGGFSNEAGGLRSFVGGGQFNTASSTSSTVGGGTTNTASSTSSTVGGGTTNTASGISSTVGGGTTNTASGTSSTVAGGNTNTASSSHSTVAGGDENTASGGFSTVAGGLANTASGDYSLAVGHRAKATQTGSFVWGDSTSADLTSPGSDTFTVRAAGGIWLGTNSSPSITAGHFIDTSTGAYLTSTGVWTDSSDRALKRDFRPLNKRSVLEKVARMPITSWSYKAESPSIRHIGPVAQDFYKAFGLGLDDKHIGTIDEGGVALAAIQGLYRQNQELKRQNRALNARLTKLERAVARLAR